MQRLRKPLLFIALAAPVIGLTACSTSDLLHVAVSRDPSAALAHFASYKVRSYEENPMRLVHDVQQAQRDYRKLVDILSGKAGAQWGRRDALLPGNKRYVKYTQNYMSRAVVQFDTGRITVETLDATHPQQSLKNAIVTTLLTPNDPRAVDLYSDKTIALTGRPYLYGLVEDQNGRPVGTPAAAESYADYLLQHAQKTRTTQTDHGAKQVHYVQLAMVSDYENREAQQYEPTVDRYAAKYGISKSLVFAVIKTESNFNPFAVSSAPAYGLMQLVPETAGREAYALTQGESRTPSKDYLFDAQNNIELGTAYLHIIEQRYLNDIQNPLNREYCTIAAYNGGAGGVLNFFSKDRGAAPDVINRLTPAQVYHKLVYDYPRAETRRYVVKVLDARREFIKS